MVINKTICHGAYNWKLLYWIVTSVRNITPYTMGGFSGAYVETYAIEITTMTGIGESGSEDNKEK